MTSLLHRTRHAARWSAVDIVFRQGVQFAVVMVLARALSPEDFGVIAMLALFIGLAGIVIDGGFGTALVQRQRSTNVEETTIFFFNVILSVLVALLLAASAGWIAEFFSQPVLVELTYALAFNVFLNAFGSIHIALLTRAMDFKTIAKIGGVSSLVSGSLAVGMAYLGYGVWSLVGQAIASTSVTVVLLWALHPWRPGRSWDISSLAPYFRFGKYDMGANLLDVLSTNLTLMMIGKLFSSRDVGLYDRAQKTQQLPINLMMGIINRVAYSAFSSAAGDKAVLISGTRRALVLCMLINTPVLVGICVLAEPLVRTLFGKQWLPCVPALQVLSLAGLMWPMHLINLSVLKAQGHGKVFFWITVAKKLVTITITVAASFYGILAVAWAQVVASLLAYFINAHYSNIHLSYGARKQIVDILPTVLTAIPMGATVFFVAAVLELSAPLVLAIAGMSGFVVYLATSFLFCKGPLHELFALVGINAPGLAKNREKF